MRTQVYKLIILITFKPTSTTLGNACRIEMASHLSKHFDALIITNRKDLIIAHIQDCPIYEAKYKPNKSLPIISKIFEHKRIAGIINKMQHDFVFMFDNTSSATLWLKKPVFQYVHQFGARTAKKNRSIIKLAAKKTISSIYDYFYFKGLRSSRCVFVVSKPIIEIMKQHNVNNLEWTPHGMDINKYQNPIFHSQHEIIAEYKKKGFFIVAYTGWVTENRGFKIMLDSIKEAVNQDQHILFVVAGADKVFSNKIEQFKQQHNLEHNIINLGIVDFSLIPGILHLSDVCLSFWDSGVEAFRLAPPQKVVEYFAAGKPVICNKIETHEWLVTHGKTGYILGYNANEASDAILMLKRNPALLDEMSKNALHEAAKYDIHTVYNRMVQKMKSSL